MPWWIPLVMPTATFIHSHLPPLPGFASVVEIEDEEYILVEHDAYVGAVDKVEKKAQPRSTDERLAEEREKERMGKEETRKEAGLDGGGKGDGSMRKSRTREEEKVGMLMDRIDKEIVEASGDEKFEWRWFGEADVRNRDIYIYNKRRLLIEAKLKAAVETKHFMPLGRDVTKIDEELWVLDMARQQLDRRFAGKYDYIPPRETWEGVEQREETMSAAHRAVLKGVVAVTYGINLPFF